MDNVIEKLHQWRNADHADAIVLSRHEICVLLEGIRSRDEYIIGLECALEDD